MRVNNRPIVSGILSAVFSVPILFTLARGPDSEDKIWIAIMAIGVSMIMGLGVTFGMIERQKNTDLTNNEDK